MIEASPAVGTPAWWLHRLLDKLAVQADHCEALDIYYRGENGIPIGADKAVRESYRRLMRMARTNFAELVVEAVRERMKPVGFRTGADSDDLGDSEAWRIWQANHLDADSSLVDRNALAMSLSFVIVGGVDPEIGAPLITPEDPRQVVVETDPARRRKVRAALKYWSDDVMGLDRAFLYLPGQVFKAARDSRDGRGVSKDGWVWEETTPEQLPPGLADVVPVVPFNLRPDTSGSPLGEFEPHLGVLDRINYTILNRLEIATLQAFRQRGISGVPNTDENGNEIDYDDIFASDPGALWVMPESAKVWESQQVDLGPLRSAIRDDVQDLAATTRTPLFYLTPEAANGSAEGASLAREGLVFKTQDRIVQASESWEQVMSLAFRFAGDATRARRGDMETLWASPERISTSEKYDAAAKAGAAGVPTRTIWADILGFSPQQIERMEIEAMQEALINAPLPEIVDGEAPAAGMDPDAIKAAADAMGVLIRAGVEPEDAARRVGLPGIKFTGAVPVSLRLPDDEAQGLEGK